MLAEAVVEASSRMPVVCGYVPGANLRQQEWPVPINMMAAALGLSAYANLTVDADDFVRRQELTEAPGKNPDDPVARSLAMHVV